MYQLRDLTAQLNARIFQSDQYTKQLEEQLQQGKDALALKQKALDLAYDWTKKQQAEFDVYKKESEAAKDNAKKQVGYCTQLIHSREAQEEAMEKQIDQLQEQLKK